MRLYTEVFGALLRVDIRTEEGKWERRSYLRSNPEVRLIENLEARAELELELRELAKAQSNVKMGTGRFYNAVLFIDAAKELRRFIKTPIISTHRTVATVTLESPSSYAEHDILMTEGIAYLSPEDYDDPEEGRQLALERALAPLTEQAAGAILTEYLSRGGAKPWRIERGFEAERLAIAGFNYLTTPFMAMLGAPSDEQDKAA